MALHWATPNVEACLPPELFARLNEAQTDPWAVLSDGDARTIPLMNGKTGELLTYVKAEGPRRVQRGRLRDLFGTGLDIQFGMKLDSVSVEGDTVTATFNDGVEVRRGRYLVGADGREYYPLCQKLFILTFRSARSKVRSLLVPVDASELHPAPVTILVSLRPKLTTENAVHTVLLPVLEFCLLFRR